MLRERNVICLGHVAILVETVTASVSAQLRKMKPYDRCPGWTVSDVQEEYAKGSRRRRSFWQIDVASSLS